MVEPNIQVQMGLDWPARAIEAVNKGDYLGAIDALVAAHAAVPDGLLDAASAMLTSQSASGQIYKVERYLGRVRVHIVPSHLANK